MDRTKVDELAAWDRLMSMRTQQDADDFIDPILVNASPAEYRVVKLAFMGDLLTAAYGKPGTMVQGGPRGAEPTASGSHFGGGSQVHKKAYNMMELADSVHDAATRRTKTSASSRIAGKKKQVPALKDRLEVIQHCVGLESLPIVSVRHAVKHADWEAIPPGQYKYETKRRQMTLNDVHVWENFIEIMTTNPTLEFADDEETPVPNPMCGKNFTEGMFAFDEDLDAPFEEQYAAYLADCVKIAEHDLFPDLGVYNIIDGSYARAVGGSVYVDMLKEWMKSLNPGLTDVMSPYVDMKLRMMSDARPPLNTGDIVNVEVWCLTNDRQIIQLSQLADLCRSVRLKFGRNARFMPDSGAMIIQLLTGFRFCYEAFKRNFEVDAKDAAEYAPSGPMTEQLLRESLSKIRNDIDVHWSSWYCDGSLMDSKEPMKGLRFSNKKTGDVFHPESTVQVTMGHSTPTEYRYVVKAPTLGIPETDFRADLRPTGEFDPTGTSPLYAWFVGDEEIDNSATAAAIAVEDGTSDWLAAGKPREGYRDAAIDLTMKRAGDWAMIRHCKNENVVFCTVDRFAALCAMMMDVDVMFLRIQKHPTLVQYSFALHSIDRSEPAVGGGSYDLVPLCLALFSVIVAMSSL